MKSPQKSYLATTRRVFLNILTGGVTGGLLSWFFYPIFRFLIPPKDCSQNLDVVQINAMEVPPGKSKIISYKENPTIIINTSQGMVAMSAVCTHLGCIVQWDDSGQEIVGPVTESEIQCCRHDPQSEEVLCLKQTGHGEMPALFPPDRQLKQLAQKTS